MGWDLPAGVEDGLVVGDEDVDAVDVAAAGGDALGQLRHDAHRVLAAGRTEKMKFFHIGARNKTEELGGKRGGVRGTGRGGCRGGSRRVRRRRGGAGRRRAWRRRARA